MKQLILGLLKLLLQIILFLLLGKWVQIGPREQKPLPRKEARKQRAQRDGSLKRGDQPRGDKVGRGRPLFDRTRRVASRSPEQPTELMVEELQGGESLVSLEELSAGEPLPSLEGLTARGVPRDLARSRRKRRPPLPTVPTPSSRQPLSAALRDPVALREALTLGIALRRRGPR